MLLSLEFVFFCGELSTLLLDISDMLCCVVLLCIPGEALAKNVMTTTPESA